MSKAQKQLKTNDYPERRSLIIVNAAFIVLYLLAVLFPDNFWGLHWIKYAGGWSLLFWVASITFFVFGISNKKLFNSTGKFRFFDKTSNILIFALALGLLFYAFPVQTDIYGDSRLFIRWNFNKVAQYDPKWIIELLSPNIFVPINGENTVFSIIRLMAHFTGMKAFTAFRIFNAVCGTIYIFTLLKFVTYYFKDSLNKIIAIIAGLSAGFLQLFFGTTEIYALTMIAESVFMMVLLVFLREMNREWMILSLVALFLVIKSHSTNFILAPVLGLVLLSYFRKDDSKIRSLMRWKSIILFVIVPITIISALVYFFYMGNYAASHVVHYSTYLRHIFLPVVSTYKFPLSYTVFHWSHLFDYFNQIVMGSGFMVMLLMFAITQRKSIDWNKPVILFTGLASIFYFLLYLGINPQLTMQRDWDLFMIPAPVYLFTALAILGTLRDQPAMKKHLLAVAISIAMFVYPMFIVNANRQYLSERLIATGIRTYYSYYVSSAYVINNAIKITDDPAKQLRQYLDVLERMKPINENGIDKEYALIAKKTADLYLSGGDFYNASQYYALANRFDRDAKQIIYGLTITNHALHNYKVAYKWALDLLKINPNEVEYLKLAMDCSLQTGDIINAELYGKRILELAPGEEQVRMILSEIQK